LRVLTDTRRGSTRTEIGKEGEGTPAKTAAELLVTVGEEAPAIALDLQRGRGRLGDMAVLDFDDESWAK
jgi:hypothetical protein